MVSVEAAIETSALSAHHKCEVTPCDCGLDISLMFNLHLYKLAYDNCNFKNLSHDEHICFYFYILSEVILSHFNENKSTLVEIMKKVLKMQKIYVYNTSSFLANVT